MVLCYVEKAVRPPRLDREFLLQNGASLISLRAAGRHRVLRSCLESGDRMRRQILLTCLASVFLPAISVAQMGRCYGNVHVHVVYGDSRPAAMNLQVRLMPGSSEASVVEGFTNDTGVAVFNFVTCGMYHVDVSGDGIQNLSSEQFEIDNRKMAQTQFVTVHRTGEGNPSASAEGDATVDVAALNIPSDARKEFDKASDAMAKQDWKKALERLNKAVTIYPKYAAAYNNMGVVYGKMNDVTHQREALQHAIGVDEHFASAFQNLGILALTQQDFKGAEGYLEKATQLEPNNARHWLLLANAQLMNKDYDDAIVSAAKVHMLPHENMALSHYIAAKAYEHEGKLDEAKLELKIFLKEEPPGARADRAREELKAMDQHGQ